MTCRAGFTQEVEFTTVTVSQILRNETHTELKTNLTFVPVSIQCEWLQWGSLCTAPQGGHSHLCAIVCCSPYDMLGKILRSKKYRFSMCHSTLRKKMYYEINKMCKPKAFSFESKCFTGRL